MSCRNYCAVFGCKSQQTNKTLSFFKLPQEEARLKEWCKIIDRPDLVNAKPSSFRVCSKHFEDSMLTQVPNLIQNAIPTKLLPNQHQDEETLNNVEMDSEDPIQIKTELMDPVEDSYTVGTQTDGTPAPELTISTILHLDLSPELSAPKIYEPNIVIMPKTSNSYTVGTQTDDEYSQLWELKYNLRESELKRKKLLEAYQESEKRRKIVESALEKIKCTLKPRKRKRYLAK